MPLEAPISTKWQGKGALRASRPTPLRAPQTALPRKPRPRAARVLLAAWLLAVPAAAIPSRSEAPVVRKALDQMARMEYAAAESTLAGLPPQSPARPFFTGIASMNRFLDQGDTTALRHAERVWDSLSPRGGTPAAFRATDPKVLKLYRGLTGMQLSYAASLRGQRLRSTTLALAARAHLEDLAGQGRADQAENGPPEARATLMLYEYYRGRLLEKVPFVGEAVFDVKAFARAADASPGLRDVLLGSLFWIHLDQGRFSAADAIVGEFLGRYPENRLARQMRAVARYRSGRAAEAREDFEALKAEYAARPRAAGELPLGYYRCVGNLARLHAARGDRRATGEALAEWRRAEEAGLMPWLPPALKRDLARL